MDSVDRFFKQHGIKVVLGLCVLVGVLGVLVFKRDGPLPSEFFEHVSMALAIAGFIGLFIDFTLQRQIAKNVFEAAVGYLLPDELRGELVWLYGQPFLCYDHTQTLRLETIEDEANLLQLRCEVTRDMKNVTSGTQPFIPGVGIEENLHKGRPSKILSLTYQAKGEPKSRNYAERVERKGVGIRAATNDKNESDRIQIRSGATFRICFEYEKTVRLTDLEYFHFSAPTSNVTIVLYAPETVATEVLFSHRDNDPRIVRTGPHTWKLNGVLLPLQAIRIQWHSKPALDEWERTASQ